MGWFAVNWTNSRVSAAPLLDHSCADSGSSWRQQRKMAAPASGIFLLNFYTAGGSGDVSSIFTYFLEVVSSGTNLNAGGVIIL